MSNPIVTIEMENGDIMKAELYPEIAPNTVNNFISLEKKEKRKREKRKRDKRAEKRGINPNTKNKTKSKFSMKYSDRIKSIKESEEHPRRNEQRR